MIPTSTSSRLTLNRLRIPCARTATLVYGFSREGRTNIGYTLAIPAGEPAVAPGAGIVERVEEHNPDWAYSTDLAGKKVYEVTINHGNKVTTFVSGLASVQVARGSSVVRGEALGPSLTGEIHFRILLLGEALDPAGLGRHFALYNGQYVPGQDRNIRFAPDKVSRDPSSGFLVRLYNNLRYFKDLLPGTYLLNVDFNGSGAKTGAAATGVDGLDFWNVYEPTDFYTSGTYACGYGTVFSSSPVVYLYDYQAMKSAAWLEKLIEPASPFYGSGPSWDPMLGTWIGGYAGVIPTELFFNIRNLPVGSFDLFLYGFQGPATLMVSVNSGAIDTQVINPTATPSFVEGVNYARFSVTVPFGGILNVKVFGYASGLQIRRT